MALKKLRKKLPGSYDVIGDIAVLPLYAKNTRAIAKKLISEHKNIHSVFQKTGRVKGRLRKPILKFLLGEEGTETIHKESNCLLKVDLQTCYFSPRLSNDRLEVARQVKQKEKILVLFAGVGPYALVIAKNKKPSIVYAVEVNRAATKYSQENAKLNKLDNLIVLQGDVKKILPRLKKKIEKFDRIVMPRPQLKDDFLKEALSVSKKGTIINFHDFLQEKDIPHVAIAKIKEAAKKARKKVKILRWKKIGDIAPYKYRIRVDFRIC